MKSGEYITDSSEEVRRLRGCINDLVSLLSLPAMWSGREPLQVLEILLDSLLGMLRLDFIHIRLNDEADGSPVEAARVAHRQEAAAQPQEIGRALEQYLTRKTPGLPLVVPNPVGEGELSVAYFYLGLDEQTGVIIAGSERADFPTRTEGLLLRVAANQTAIALQEAKLLRERTQAESKLREQTEVVETINRIGQILSAELDLKKLVQAVTDAATELTGARFGSFFYNVHGEAGSGQMLYTLSGLPLELFSRFPMPRATDLFGPALEGEGTVCIDDVEKDSRYGKNSPYYGLPPGYLPVTSYLAVPVRSRSGEVLGGLFFGHPDEGVFTERAARIVEGLAAQAAIAMDNAKLYQSAQQALAEREGLLNREQAALRESEQANRAKDEFLSMLSHEIRTPLNAILGWTRLMTTGKLDRETLLTAINTIDRNAKSQARLIDDMLDVSRIITGNLRLDAQPVDLPVVINAAIDTVRPTAEAKDIRVQVVMDFGTGQVLGDPVRLQQVIWNLIANAIKFTPRGGRVQVQLARINSHIEITVSDSGPGIEEDFLPYVFDRFRQADSTTTRKHGGLGLGLAIVRHLVELHGGSVMAGNREQEQGAVFTVKLPVIIVRKPTEPLAIEVERVHPVSGGIVAFDNPPALDGIKVLIVDDEPDARRLLAAVLAQCRADVKTCGSTAEALEALEQYKPDVLVSDIGMPGEDGYVLIKKVRALESKRGGRTPAVALTAYARAEDRLRALSAGYNMHVPKPVEPAEIAIVIASLTGQNGTA